MKYVKYRVSLKTMILALAMIVALSSNVYAQENNDIGSKKSDYLLSYSAYVHSIGNGKIQVWFDVTSTYVMDDIGATSVQIYESKDNLTWKWVQTYTNEFYPYMLGHNKEFYDSCVTYQGVTGRYYKAKVCIYAGYNDKNSDTRCLNTNSERAT